MSLAASRREAAIEPRREEEARARLIRLPEGRVPESPPLRTAPAAFSLGRHLDLTKREMEVLRELGHGLSNGEIASVLTIAEQTAKYHITNINRKLGATNRTMAVVKAWEMGLVPRPRIDAIIVDGVLFKRVDE